MLTDIEIAQGAKMLPISEVAEKIGNEIMATVKVVGGSTLGEDAPDSSSAE